jgi:putative CocE/NonD family hydrolase
VRRHPLIDEYWQSKELDLEAIVQPAYVVAGWADQGLHLRGTIAAWRRMTSPEKWLEIHGQKKWAHYYRPKSRARQLAFFDHYLFDKPTALSAWPTVRYELRDRHGVARERADTAFPPACAELTEFFLRADGSLASAAAEPDELRYDARAGEAAFDLAFASETEITGNASLRLWVEADNSDDMDLFVALQKLDRHGELVGFTFYAFYENGPVALGWLRASHRALDPALGSPDRPFHPHVVEERLTPGQCVAVEIEIWPSSTRFSAGETLRLVVSGKDIYPPEPGLALPFAVHEETHNSGAHIIRMGGEFDSKLRLPVIGRGKA